MKYMISLYHITLLLLLHVICILYFVMAMSHAAEHCRGQLRDLGLSPEEDGVELRCGNEGCIRWYQMWALQALFFLLLKNNYYRRFLFLFAFKWFSDSTWFNLIQPDSTSQESRHTTQVVFFLPRWLRCLRTQFRGTTSCRVQAEPLWRQSQGRSNVSWCCNGLFPCEK